MMNVELSEAAATGCARSSDEFQTFNIRYINSAIAA
jgi:hypothetical protein